MPYWRRNATEIWILPLIGWNELELMGNQSATQIKEPLWLGIFGVKMQSGFRSTSVFSWFSLHSSCLGHKKAWGAGQGNNEMRGGGERLSRLQKQLPCSLLKHSLTYVRVLSELSFFSPRVLSKLKLARFQSLLSSTCQGRSWAEREYSLWTLATWV